MSILKTVECPFSKQWCVYIQNSGVSIFKTEACLYSKQWCVYIQNRGVSIFKTMECLYSKQRRVYIQNNGVSIFRPHSANIPNLHLELYDTTEPSHILGGVDPIPCMSTTGSQTPARGPPSFSPHTSSSAATPTGFVHKSQTVSVVGMSGQLKRCNESWFGSLQSGQFAAGCLAGSILCR